MQDQAVKWMRYALNLAKKAQGHTFPNPLVGAVVVKGGRQVGGGLHKRAGGPHAEVFALRRAGLQARGAEMFCTLEPCSHQGRTGPCVEEIIRARIKKVYVGIKDPNPLTKGKGIRRLREAGIKVQVGLLEREIRELNESFFCAMTKQRPLVTIKIAQSLDGKIATRSGASKWITHAASRRHAHRSRSFFDAIIVGIHTVLADDPRLEAGKGHRLTKIVVDARLQIPLEARLLKTRQPVIVAAVKKDRAREARLVQRGVKVLYTRSDRGRVDLRQLLKKLHALEIRHLLVEGGATLIGSFLDNRLADKAMIYIAPKIIGGAQALVSVKGEGVSSLRSAVLLKNSSVKNIKGDYLLEGYLAYP